MLQCVAVCCSLVQRVTLCGTVLHFCQCIAVSSDTYLSKLSYLSALSLWGWQLTYDTMILHSHRGETLSFICFCSPWMSSCLEHIKLPAKLLDDFLWSNKSNIHQSRFGFMQHHSVLFFKYRHNAAAKQLSRRKFALINSIFECHDFHTSQRIALQARFFVTGFWWVVYSVWS